MTPERPAKRALRGRPPLPEADRPRHAVTIRLNDATFAALVRRAQHAVTSVTGEATRIVWKAVR